jgi:hypothetical protein
MQYTFVRLLMRPSLVLIACLLGPGCTSLSQAPALKITSFEQGLARPDGKGGWEIYEKGNDFQLIVNGVCTVAGEQKPCLRHAVSFQYESPLDSTTLTCTARFSEPSDVVDVNAKHGDQVKEFSGNTELRGPRGQVFWHGYTIPDGNTAPHRTSMRCVHQGIEVLTYQFTVTEQPNNSMQPTGRKRPGG